MFKKKVITFYVEMKIVFPNSQIRVKEKDSY